MLIKADNLTKLKKAASTLEGRLRNQSDLDKLKLQFEKIWCYSTGTSARYSSESEKNYKNRGWSNWCGNSPIKGLGITGCIYISISVLTRCRSRSPLTKLCFTPQRALGAYETRFLSTKAEPEDMLWVHPNALQLLMGTQAAVQDQS